MADQEITVTITGTRVRTTAHNVGLDSETGECHGTITVGGKALMAYWFAGDEHYAEV